MQGKGAPLPLQPIPKSNHNTKTKTKTKNNNKIKVVYTENLTDPIGRVTVEATVPPSSRLPRVFKGVLPLQLRLRVLHFCFKFFRLRHQRSIG